MISVLYDNLLGQDVDVIVNPANHQMLHGGGLALTIAMVAGDAVVKESQQQVKDRPIKTGEAIITGPGQLPQRAIVHTVGPIYNEDYKNSSDWYSNNADKPQEALLADAYLNAVRLAAQDGHTSIAFPAVSCGVFRYPVRKAAPIAIKALREAENEYPEVDDIRICVLDPAHYQAFMKALEGSDEESN